MGTYEGVQYNATFRYDDSVVSSRHLDATRNVAIQLSRDGVSTIESTKIALSNMGFKDVIIKDPFGTQL